MRLALPLSLTIRAVTAVVCVAIVGMFAWQTWWAWSVQNREWQRETTNLAKSFAEDAESTFAAADAALDGIQLWTELRGIGSSQRDSLQRLVNVRKETLPQIHGLFIFDAHGRLVVGTGGGARFVHTNFNDRDYFQYAARHPSLLPHVSGPVISRRDGSWVVTLSRRLDNPDGSLRGVAAASLSLAYFEANYAKVDLGPHAIISLILDDGTVVVRKTAGKPYVGADVRLGPLFHHMQTAASGQFTGESIIDGVRRLTAYRHLDQFPLTTALSIPTEDIFGAWRKASLIGLVGVCALIAIIVYLARLLLSEIREREQAQQRLAELVFVDGLTGLANRRYFDSRLEIEWRRAVREKTELALLMIDADLFKTYNDRYGHQMGDDVLKAVAECIRDNMARAGDMGVRYGGEEFAVLLPGTGLAGGLTVAQKILSSIRALKLPHLENPSAAVTVSIGLAALPPTNERDARSFVNAADEALYEAKRHGRNRIEVAVAVAAA